MPNPLEWLGAILPTAPPAGPGRKALYEDEQKARQKKFREENPIRGAIGNAADKAFGFLGGFTGIGANDSDASKWGELASAATDLIPEKALAAKMVSLAGMPFASYGKRLIHGTPKAFDYIDPEKLREGAHGMKFFGTPEPEMSNAFVEMGQDVPSEGIKTGQSLMFKPEAKNVLDLMNPDSRDIHKIIRNMEPDVQSRYMDYFNDLMERGNTSEEAYGTLAQVMGVPQGVAERSGFDAVRFPYGEKKQEAWGFPESTPIKSYYGDAPLNPAAGPRTFPVKKVEATISDRPQIGDVLPSGRRFGNKSVVTPKVAEPVTPQGPKRMSLAELMNKETPKKTAEVTTATGKKLSLAEIKALLNK